MKKKKTDQKYTAILFTTNHWKKLRMWIFEYTKIFLQTSNSEVARGDIQGDLHFMLNAVLPQIYPREFVYFLLQNYFRFLDNIFHRWLQNLHIKQLYELTNSRDEDLKFIFENLSRNVEFSRN